MKMPNPEDFIVVDTPLPTVAAHATGAPEGSAIFSPEAYAKSIEKTMASTHSFLMALDPGSKDKTAYSYLEYGEFAPVPTFQKKKLDDIKPKETDVTITSIKSMGKSWASLVDVIKVDEIHLMDLETYEPGYHQKMKDMIYGQWPAFDYGFTEVKAHKWHVKQFAPPVEAKRLDVSIMPFRPADLVDLQSFKQAAYDRVAYGLRQQGGPARSPAYRARNGARCAVGFLIQPEQYFPELETMMPSHIRFVRALQLPERLTTHRVGKFLDEMRTALHDDFWSSPDFADVLEDRLTAFRARHGLTENDTTQLAAYDADVTYTPPPPRPLTTYAHQSFFAKYLGA